MVAEVNKVTKEYWALLAQSGCSIEARKGFGVFIVRGKDTLFGFNNWQLCVAYLERAAKRGYLYAPTAKETYG